MTNAKLSICADIRLKKHTNRPSKGGAAMGAKERERELKCSAGEGVNMKTI